MLKHLCRVVALVLVVQFSLSPVMAYAASGNLDNTPKAIQAVKKNQKSYSEFLEAVAKAKEGDEPPQIAKDKHNIFSMLTQYLETPEGSRINLYDNVMEYDIPYTSQPYKKTTIEAVEGEVHITLKGNKPYKHIIAGLDATDILLDENYIFIMAKDGKLYTVEKASFGKFFGQNPFLVSHVAWHPEGADKNDNFKINLVKEDTKPLDEKILQAKGLIPTDSDIPYLVEGDIIIYNSQEEPVSVISRSSVNMKFFEDTMTYGLLEIFENPDLFKSNYEKFFDELATIGEEAQQKLIQSIQDDGLAEVMSNDNIKSAFKATSFQNAQTLYDNAKAIHNDPSPRRPLFLDVWSKNYEEHMAIMKKKEDWLLKNNTKLKRAWAKTYDTVIHGTASKMRGMAAKFRQNFTKEGRRKVARRLKKLVLNSGQVGLYVVASVGINSMTNGALVDLASQGASAVVDGMNWLGTYAFHLAGRQFPIINYPEFTNPAWKIALMMNSAYVMYLGGMFVGGVINQKGMLTTLMQAGMKAAGYITAVPLRQLAKKFNQPNLIPMMQAGQNPSVSMGTKSLSIGNSQVNIPYPVVEGMNPISASSEELAQRRVEIEKKIHNKRNIKAMAWYYAHLPIIQQGDMGLDDFLAYKLQNAATPKEKDMILVMANDLQTTIGKYSEEDFAKGLQNLTKEEKLAIFEGAHDSFKKWNEASFDQAYKGKLTANMKQVFAERWPKYWSDLGYSTARELMNGVPDAATGAQAIRQSSMDMLPMPWIYAFDGGRANPLDPVNLTYDPNGMFGMVNGDYMADYGMQLGIYSTLHPADSFLSYNQGVKIDTEVANRLITDKLKRMGVTEVQADKMVNGGMTFGRTFGKLLKQAVDFEEVQYGKRFLMKKFFSRLKAFIPFTLVGVTTTMLSLYMANETGHAFGDTFGSRMWQSFLAKQWGTAMGLWYYAWIWIPINGAIITFQNKLAIIREAHNNILARIGIALDKNNPAQVKQYIDELDEFYQKYGKALPTFIDGGGDDAVKAAEQIIKNGENVFKYAAGNRQFVTKANEMVLLMWNLIGSYATTVLGSNFGILYMQAKTVAYTGASYLVSFAGHITATFVADTILGKKLAPQVKYLVETIEKPIDKAYTWTGKKIVETKKVIKENCNKLFKTLLPH